MEIRLLPVERALGCILAYSTPLTNPRFEEGHVLAKDDLDVLADAGVRELAVVRPAADELSDNEAVAQLSSLLRHATVRGEGPRTGRYNILAEVPGLVSVHADAVSAFNSVDSHISIATRSQHASVSIGERVATLKCLPHFLSSQLVAAYAAAIGDGPDAVVQVLPFRTFICGLLVVRDHDEQVSEFPAVRDVQDFEGAVGLVGGSVIRAEVDRSTMALLSALRAFATRPVDLVVVTSERPVLHHQDEIVAAIRSGGGCLQRLSIPADPGNLVGVATLAGSPVIIVSRAGSLTLPPAVRIILGRWSAGLPIDRSALNTFGVGGLLPASTQVGEF